MKRFHFRWFDPVARKEKLTTIIADTFEEAIGFIRDDIREINRTHNCNIKTSDFIPLGEEEETRPWARKGVDIQW